MIKLLTSSGTKDVRTALSLASPEARLLIAVAKSGARPSGMARIGELGKDVDWHIFEDYASKHRLLPLSFCHFRRMTPCPVPRNKLAAMWGHSELVSRRNAEMYDELLRIISLLQSKGVRTLAYKGPMLAFSAYSDLTLREFGDLDLLLRPPDILRAKAMLEPMGYRSEYQLSAAVEGDLFRSGVNYHLSLDRESPQIRVELHWKTDPEFPVEPQGDENWWSCLSTVRHAGLDMSSFSPEELVLVLCLHGSKHFWSRMVWLVDVSELIRQESDLNWAWIIRRSEELSAGRRLAVGLHLLDGLLEVPMPAGVMNWMAMQRKASRVAGTIAATVLDPATPVPNALRRLRLNFALYETWKQRWRHFMGVVFRPTIIEWIHWPLPRPFFFLYPVLRLGRLMRKYFLPGSDENVASHGGDR